MANMNDIEGYSGKDPKKIAERDRALADRARLELEAQRQHEAMLKKKRTLREDIVDAMKPRQVAK